MIVEADRRTRFVDHDDIFVQRRDQFDERAGRPDRHPRAELADLQGEPAELKGVSQPLLTMNIDTAVPDVRLT